MPLTCRPKISKWINLNTWQVELDVEVHCTQGSREGKPNVRWRLCGCQGNRIAGLILLMLLYSGPLREFQVRRKSSTFSPPSTGWLHSIMPKFESPGQLHNCSILSISNVEILGLIMDGVQYNYELSIYNYPAELNPGQYANLNKANFGKTKQNRLSGRSEKLRTLFNWSSW